MLILTPIRRILAFFSVKLVGHYNTAIMDRLMAFYVFRLLIGYSLLNRDGVSLLKPHYESISIFWLSNPLLNQTYHVNTYISFQFHKFIALSDATDFSRLNMG